jgi:hypothetical protein
MEIIDFAQMMERAIRRRDRSSLLALLEGSVESKKSSAIFIAFLDAGGLNILNTWLSDAVRYDVC